MRSSPTSLSEAVLAPGKPPTLHVEAAGDAASWVHEHRNALRAFVTEHGALLVRGLALRDVAGTAAAFRALGSLIPMTEPFAPRKRYAEGVYSSAKWPPNQPMCMHHELSYVSEPPRLLMFACLREPTAGGATPVADASVVLESLPAPWVERFEREGWLLTRNYHEEIGSTLEESFGTEDRRGVEAYCRAHAIDFEWRPDGALRTRQRRSAVVNDPVTGRRCWFNQIAFLNRWTMDPDLREYLEDVYGEDGLPFDTRFGDGDPIGADVVRAIHEAYESIAVREPWRAGDLLLVDNLGTAHGRDAFEGPREVLVAMSDPVRPGVE